MLPVSPGLFTDQLSRPLADRLRPDRLEDVVGQDHLLSPTGPIGRMVMAKRLTSLILWGGPGCGKTTIARLLAKETGALFQPISAVAAGVSDLRKIFETAQSRHATGLTTILFVDEIHRFNRAQQDVLLPYVEDGTVILVGATTENPSFELNAALLSRAHVYVLNRLDAQAMDALLVRAETLMGRALPLNPEARASLCTMADGDGRYALGLAEALLNLPSETPPMDTAAMQGFVQRRPPLYDKAQDSHYNLISALHKSLRGSDCDAALYWLHRMLEGGEDARYILRRLTRFASEDIGMADPNALPFMLAAWQAYERIGSPEGDLNVTHAVIYLATAPKSNAAYHAHKAAKIAAQHFGSLLPPKHILNAPTSMMREMGYGDGYTYDHDTEHGFSGQNYFPDGMNRQQFYHPVERGFERDIAKRLAYWEKLRTEKQ